MPRSLRLDETNLELIRLLREDGRMTNGELAQRVGLPASTVRDRVRRLCEERIIHVAAVTDIGALGYDFLAYLGIRVEGRSPREVAQDIAVHPEVTSVTLVSGSYDIWAVVLARSKRELSSFLAFKLGNIQGIREIDSSLALEILRYDFRFSLPSGQNEAGSPPGQSELIDELDAQIIEAFRRDGRISNREVARQLGVSEGTVRARLRRLQEENAVRFTAVASAKAMGKDTWFVVGLLVERPELYNVAAALERFEQVSMIAVSLGRHDLLAVAGGSRAELVDLMEKIAAIPGVRRTETADTLATIKYIHTIALLNPPHRN